MRKGSSRNCMVVAVVTLFFLGVFCFVAGLILSQGNVFTDIIQKRVDQVWHNLLHKIIYIYKVYVFHIVFFYLHDPSGATDM